MSKAEPQWSLADLADQSGVPARTIRFYIARGLLEGPVGAGRGAYYTRQHLKRLDEIRIARDKGLMLSQIVTADRPAHVQPQAAWQFAITDDVTVTVKANIAPWRMHRIQSAIEDMARQLAETDNNNE